MEWSGVGWGRKDFSEVDQSGKEWSEMKLKGMQ